MKYKHSKGVGGPDTYILYGNSSGGLGVCVGFLQSRGLKLVLLSKKNVELHNNSLFFKCHYGNGL